MATEQKRVEVVPITPPPPEKRVQRNARFAGEGEKKTRYSLPNSLDSASPVGYRHRVSMTVEEAESIMPLLSLERPTGFRPNPASPTEGELFEESSLGILTSRQSTNYRGHRQVTLGPEDSENAREILASLDGLEAAPLENAAYTHIVLTRPYRTPFTLLLTFIGHKPVVSLATVAVRALRKRFQHIDDIPTIGYLQEIHVGILADAMERAALIASGGTRRAQVFMAPFSGEVRRRNASKLRALENLAGMTAAERSQGWRVGIVAQVGEAIDGEDMAQVPKQTWRKLGANMMAFRSERIQPGVNQEESAPDPYQHRQDMDVPDELTVMAGRAGYNAFAHWTGSERERSKDLLLFERIDVLTPNGKERLRDVRDMLNGVTDRVVKALPLWADLPTGKAFSRNALRGKKAFALAGQRIYIGGLDRGALERDGVDWTLGIRAFGAAAARSALVAEIMGCVGLPEDCDLLAGICLMAGPVNQNDIGKSFYGQKDLLAGAHDNDPTSLLVWTLKAKTVADPIGNEEQLLNAARKGALVDLRPGPHDVIALRKNSRLEPMRKRDGRVNAERAFEDVGNFVVDADAREIPGNRGSIWPDAWRNERPWS